MTQELPRLPIPKLEVTLDRYLKSVRPLLSQKEFAKYALVVNDFLNGQGPILQQRLEQHDKTQTYSWLENWWLSLAYLSWREAVLVNSNWYIIVQKHANYGQHNHAIKRAAGFITSFLDYKQMIDAGKLPAEGGKEPQCMYQYTRMFGITRIPILNEDVLVTHQDSKHIIVMIQDQIYAVDLFDQTGDRVSLSKIEEVVDLHQRTGNYEPPIGLLTGTHRDTWSALYKHLSDFDQTNKKSFETIQRALFAVSLDSLEFDDVDSFAKNVFHGFDGHNRWFDKSLSIIVSKNGMIGLNGEHSTCDALVPAFLVDYAVKNETIERTEKYSSVGAMNAPVKLKWKVDSVVSKGILDAQIFVDQLINDSDIVTTALIGLRHTVGFDGLKLAKVSPDAFIQICLQLTYYRIHRKLAPTYETASVRKYSHGRTETCRSLSLELASFVKMFDDPQIKPSDKLAAFKKSANAHVEYLKAASNGYGVDRHLLGLRLVMSSDDVKHSIFTHPVFTHSSRWILSTSALFSGERTLGTGFGCVDNEGYGMNYLIGKNMIKVGIESKKSCPETKTCKFRSTLRGVLMDLRLFVEDVSASPNL